MAITDTVAESEIMQRLRKALVDDLTVNARPDPKTLPAILVAYDPKTQLFRIAHARLLDFRVEIVYLRVCDLKQQLARVLNIEAEVEAGLSPEYGRAMAGLDQIAFQAGLVKS
jgi:hypothetical protein